MSELEKTIDLLEEMDDEQLQAMQIVAKILVFKKPADNAFFRKLTEEEFFEEVALGPKDTRPVARKRSKKAKKDIFAGIKAKMVMRIYGVSRALALEIIAGREAAKSAENGKAHEDGQKGDTDEELLSAEDFFA